MYVYVCWNIGRLRPVRDYKKITLAIFNILVKDIFFTQFLFNTIVNVY